MTEISKFLGDRESIMRHINQGSCKRSCVNILFIGAEGVGKSALANSLVKALNEDDFKEIIQGRDGDVTTNSLLSLEKYTLHEHLEALRSKDGPTYEKAGEDIPEKNGTELNFYVLRASVEEADIENVLGCLVSGMRPKGTWDEVVKPGANPLKKFSAPNPDLKIHLVCYLHAAPDPVSKKLAQSVRRATLNSKREIPVFLIITKKDKLQQESREEFIERKKEIMEMLSMGGIEERVYELSLYSEDKTLEWEENLNENLYDLWSTLLDPVYCNRNTDSYVVTPDASSKYYNRHQVDKPRQCHIQ